MLPLPGLEVENLPGSAHFIPTKAAAHIRPSRLPGPYPPTPDTQNSTQTSIAQQPQASTTLVGQQPLVACCAAHHRAAACAGLGPFTRPAPTVLLMIRFWPTQTTLT